MGDIANKLKRIIDTKEDIRQALISKGYDVPASVPFKDYAKMIHDLPCGAVNFPQIEGIVARYSAKGLTNEEMAANPVWKDLSGNGNDLQMHNFAWGGMSGVGGYAENYNKWLKHNIRADITFTDHSFNVTSVKINQMQLYYQSTAEEQPFTVPSYTVIVKGLTDGQVLEYVYIDIEGKHIIKVEKDGIFTLPSFKFAAKGNYYGFVCAKVQEYCNITIEQIPLYPDFIVSDGVDDFGVTQSDLNLEDTYTIYTPLILLKYGGVVCGKSSTADFSLNTSDSIKGIGFDSSSVWSGAIPVDLSNFALIVCKRNSQTMYIKDLVTGKYTQNNSREYIPKTGTYFIYKNSGSNCFQVAIAGQIICNGYFSTDEDDAKVLDWYKKEYPWLFPDQAWTVVGKTNEDEDRATIANITGNGNDFVLSNFGFAEGSGYGLYSHDWNKWFLPAERAEGTKQNNLVKITRIVSTDAVTFFFQTIDPSVSGMNVTIPSFKIRVSGLTDGQLLSYKFHKNAFKISEDGIYTLPSVNGVAELGGYYFYGFFFSEIQDSCNITIEQIPEYEGYLVTDGVDDRVKDSSFKLNKDWTFVGEWVLLNQKAVDAGIVKPFSFIVYNKTTGLSLFINTGTSQITIENVKSIKAICSDGRIYLDDWSEMLISKDQDITSSTSVLLIGSNGTEYTQIAFKNLGIYNNQILSKEECIKAYNYLQSLKAK